MSHLVLKLFADDHPELVLLCVNALQKGTSDMDPLTRGVALRTTCSIKNKQVSEGSLAAIQKGSLDSSVYVRKCAAISILIRKSSTPDDFERDFPESLAILNRLLGDAEITVISTTLMVLSQLWHDVSQQAMELLHPHFTRITKLIPLMDWIGQVSGFSVLGAYCMLNFRSGSDNEHYEAFLTGVAETIEFSLSPAVIHNGLAILANLNEQTRLKKPDLILGNKLLHVPSEIAGKFLSSVSVNRIKPFLIQVFGDDPSVRLAKLELLDAALSRKNAHFMLSECVTYIRSCHDDEFIEKCLDLIVRIGIEFPDLHDRCLRCAVGMIDSHYPVLSNLAVEAVGSLIDTNKDGTIMKKTCIYLSSIVETISSPPARASAVWLINMCHDTVPIIAPNVLRVLGRNVESEDCYVKLELALLAIKVLEYHKLNALGTAIGQVPQNVSQALLDPLEELCSFIFQSAQRDPVVGSLVRAASSKKFPISPLRRGKSSVISSELVEPEVRLSRPIQDSPNSLRVPKGAMKAVHHDVKSFSSDQSATNRMPNYLASINYVLGVSSHVAVPSTMKNPAPIAARSLEDLDAFFTNPTSSTSGSREEKETPHKELGGAKKATLDLTMADWLNS